MDHMIKNANMFYRSWKYWHSAMLLAKSMAVAVAYDMYLEVCEGKLDPNWKIENPIGFHYFREKLSEQMLTYSPLARQYQGDSLMRTCTQQPLNRRDTDDSGGSGSGHSAKGRPRGAGYHNVSLAQLQAAKRSKGRLCGDLTKLMKHMAPESLATGQQNAHSCVVCGRDAYAHDKICGVWLHAPATKRGSSRGATCFFDYHNDQFFGLARCDWHQLLGKRKCDWVPPNKAKRVSQSRYICQLVNKMESIPPPPITPARHATPPSVAQQSSKRRRATSPPFQTTPTKEIEEADKVAV